jgi:hypothetical protein
MYQLKKISNEWVKVPVSVCQITALTMMMTMMNKMIMMRKTMNKTIMMKTMMSNTMMMRLTDYQ